MRKHSVFGNTFNDGMFGTQIKRHEKIIYVVDTPHSKTKNLSTFQRLKAVYGQSLKVETCKTAYRD